MPNFRGQRFANAHETLIWGARDVGQSRASLSAGWSSAACSRQAPSWFTPAGGTPLRYDGTLVCAEVIGSIHQTAAQGLDACNGWTF